MKVTEHIAKANSPLLSFEIIPPLRGNSVKDITEVVAEIAKFDPAWIDVTSHVANADLQERPDGSYQRIISKKRPGTIGICGIIQNRFQIDTVAHVLCAGFTKEETEDALIELHYLGVENVLALRGDGPNYEKVISKSRSVNQYSTDLVQQIEDLKHGKYLHELKDNDSLNFCIGVAGYPEKHFEAPSLKTDIMYLKKKVEAGAEYIVTQMFFDNKHYFDFVAECRAAGITVPIIPGLKVIRNVKHLTAIPKNFYVNFPDGFVEEILANPKHIEEIGVRHAISQLEGLIEHNVPSLHFYIMNEIDSIKKILKKVGF